MIRVLLVLSLILTTSSSFAAEPFKFVKGAGDIKLIKMMGLDGEFFKVLEELEGLPKGELRKAALGEERYFNLWKKHMNGEGMEKRPEVVEALKRIQSEYYRKVVAIKASGKPEWTKYLTRTYTADELALGGGGAKVINEGRVAKTETNFGGQKRGAKPAEKEAPAKAKEQAPKTANNSGSGVKPKAPNGVKAEGRPLTKNEIEFTKQQIDALEKAKEIDEETAQLFREDLEQGVYGYGIMTECGAMEGDELMVVASIGRAIRNAGISSRNPVEGYRVLVKTIADQLELLNAGDVRGRRALAEVNARKLLKAKKDGGCELFAAL